MRFLINLLLTAVAVYILSIVLKPHVEISSFTSAIIFALVLAFLNAIVKPLLVILTLPITVITLGLFLLIINAIIILLAQKILPHEFHVDGLLWAIIFSLLLSLVSAILHRLEKSMQ